MEIDCNRSLEDIARNVFFEEDFTDYGTDILIEVKMFLQALIDERNGVLENEDKVKVVEMMMRRDYVRRRL